MDRSYSVQLTSWPDQHSILYEDDKAWWWPIHSSPVGLSAGDKLKRRAGIGDSRTGAHFTCEIWRVANIKTMIHLLDENIFWGKYKSHWASLNLHEYCFYVVHCESDDGDRRDGKDGAVEIGFYRLTDGYGGQ